MADSLTRLSRIAACAIAVLALPVVSAHAASLHIPDAEATVAQGETATFKIALSAAGALTCRAAATVSVDSAYTLDASGAITSDTPAEVTFSAAAAHGAGHNCEPTWPGAPAPYELEATVGAAADTQLGEHRGTVRYEVENAPGTGPAGKLANAGVVTLTVRVVAPKRAAPVTPQPEPRSEPEPPPAQVVLGERRAAPRPEFARSVLLTRARGRIVYRAPGGAVTSLSQPVVVPNGTVVDATRGVVEVTVERSAGGALDSADAWSGAFSVRQDRSGTTTFTLADPLAARRGARAARAQRAARSTGKRRLWVNGHGRFKTRGNRASATVRGTVWLTEDVPGGTRVRVRRGAVAVRDFIRHRTVVVRAGHSYTARRRATIRRPPAFTGRAS